MSSRLICLSCTILISQKTIKILDSQLIILKNLSEALIMVDDQGTIEFSNDALTDVLGYKPENLIGRPMSILMPEDTISGHKQKFSSFFHKPKTRKMGNTDPIKIKHQNGSIIDVEISLSSVEINRARKAIAMIVDIKRFYKYKNPLKDKLDLYSSLIEHNTDHLFQIDRDFKIRFINHVSPGLSKKKVMGASLIDLLPNEYTKDLVKNKLNKAFETGLPESYEVDFPSPLGALHYATTVTPYIKNGEVCRLNLITRNVTNDYNTKKELLDRKSFIDKIDHSSINGIYIFDMNTSKNIYINSKYTDLLGYNKEDLNNMSQEEFMLLFHPSDRQNIVEHMEDILHSKKGDVFPIEYRFKSKNGEWLWCYSQDSGFEYDSKGNIISFIGAFIDISEMKKIELELLQKNKEIENFIYHACHDIKSPINSVSQLMDLSLSDKIENFAGFEMMNQSIKRLKHLVLSLLDFGNDSTFKTIESVSIDVLLEHVLQDLSFEIESSSAKITKNKLPEISCYQIGIYRVFLNLISNAIKFRHKNAQPIIKIDCQSQVQHWKFSISDNGIGIDKNNNEAIFDAFTRLHTKSEYDGSGLGLANCRKIINKHGGDIWVENNKNGGSTFTFTISKDLDKIAHTLDIQNTNEDITA